MNNPAKDYSYQILLNAYLRELATWQHVSLSEIPMSNIPQGWQNVDSLLVINLPSSGAEIVCGIEYWSLTARHQFAMPVFARHNNTQNWQSLDYISFLAWTMREAGMNQAKGMGELDILSFRCLLSAQNMHHFIGQRQDLKEKLDGRPLSFIETEQSLLIGHQLHPVTKSREGLNSQDLQHYSPETAGHFKLHYFVAAIDLVHQDSALSLSAADLVKLDLNANGLPIQIANLRDNPDWALIPLHPWQARYVQGLPKVQALMETGRLSYLGELGDNYTATTSVRTVFQEQAKFMYKLSLNVRITNSQRINKSWELDRVLETARMMQLPVGDEIRTTVPDFEFVQEPAYISLKIKGEVWDEFSCILREAAPFNQSERDISSITALVQDNPLSKNAPSRLYKIIERLSVAEDRTLEAVARDWFQRYLDISIFSLMKLFIDWGLCFEAHAQNSLIEMHDGYPTHFYCRDGQGFFHREASHQDWCAIMPGKGETTKSILPEDLAAERLIYYPFINQVFSMINAFGTQGLLDESISMAMLRQTMGRLAAAPQRYPFSLYEVLNKQERLPCKGNLLTQLYNMDELVGDIAEQSVYVTIANPYLPAPPPSRSSEAGHA